MSWPEIKAAHKDLRNALRRDDGVDPAWLRFADLARNSPVPFHLKSILELLDESRGSHSKDQTSILDHGCGGALTLLYMAARGYTRVYGVDIGGQLEDLDALAKSKFGATDTRFVVYDGRNLPFEAESFEFVFSEEVIEHIRPDALNDYYAAEARVLRPGGIAFHRVPHRLVPFDSHTQTWLVHYLPRRWWLRALKMMGRDLTTAKEALFLRWPWVHRRLARRFIGNYEDRTMTRFRAVDDLSLYEGPKGLRRLVGWFVNLPVLGKAAGWVLTDFVMLDTVSRKPVDGGQRGG